MTGRLPYHVNQINISPYLPGSGAARNMVRSRSLVYLALTSAGWEPALSRVTACSLGAQPTAVLTQTFISKKLKQAGYATHMIGKWHVGYATWDMIPAGKIPAGISAEMSSNIAILPC